jgi:Ulp1 family protease
MAFACPLFLRLIECCEQVSECDPLVRYTGDSPCELSPGKLHSLAISFPRVRSVSISVNDSDLSCLRGHAWINDEVLNAYISLLASRSSSNIGHTNSFFYQKLERDGPEAVSCWQGIKGALISRFDIFVIPICVGLHWILAAFDFVDAQLCVYDSFHGSFPEIVARLNNFLAFQGGEPLPVAYPDVPSQTNGYDCGVFVMRLARCIFAGEPFDSFTQRDMPNIRANILTELRAINKPV